MVTILVVDECPAVRQFVDLVVGGDEVLVCGASDGFAALEWIGRRPDLVLVAKGLAGLSAAVIVSRFSGVGIPVILMTGSLDPRDTAVTGTSVGVFRKPLQVAELRAVVSGIPPAPPVPLAAQVRQNTGGDRPPRDPLTEWFDDVEVSLGVMPRRWRSLAEEGGDLHSFARDVAAIREGRVRVQPLRIDARHHVMG